MRLRLLALVTALAAAAPTAQAQTDTTSRPKTDSTSKEKSVLAGVFTEEQATKGDSEHQANCSACHGTENYVGEAFTKNWVGRTAFDLFDQLKTTMPEDNPGGLSAQQYTDIIAYIFKINGYSAGTQVLPADPEALRLIKIEAKPAGSPAQLGRRPPWPSRNIVVVASRFSTPYHPHLPIAPRARQ
jgi:mono/diheme cytochrome c family protein